MNYEMIGRNIKKFRKVKGLTQSDLAEKIGKSLSSVKKYELGLVETPIEVITQIADELDCKISDLTGVLNWDDEISVDDDPVMAIAKRLPDGYSVRELDFYWDPSSDNFGKVRLIYPNAEVRVVNIQDIEDIFFEVMNYTMFKLDQLGLS